MHFNSGMVSPFSDAIFILKVTTPKTCFAIEKYELLILAEKNISLPYNRVNHKLSVETKLNFRRRAYDYPKGLSTSENTIFFTGDSVQASEGRQHFSELVKHYSTDL